MYFTYGFPRSLACSGLGREQEPWLALQQDQQFLVAVTASTVQLWSAGLHRVRLSAVDCSTQGVGSNVDVHWCSSKSALAVLTDRGYLNIYHVSFSQEPAVNIPGITSREPCKATIYLRHTTKLECPTLPVCLGGDSKVLLLGCQDGSIQVYTWLGKPRDLIVPTYVCDEDVQLEPGSLTSMHYCDKSRLLAVVLSNGACALLSAGYSGGVSQLREVQFSHWVCYTGASCVRINAAAQLIAVGTMHGTVALYRLQLPGSQGGPDPFNMSSSQAGELPVRQLSVEPWGHPARQTGPVSKVEWSPDGRVIAVGYQNTGVVVWSASGCRLFSSLRQAPEFVRAGSLGAGTPMSTSGGHTYFSDPSAQLMVAHSVRSTDSGDVSGLMPHRHSHTQPSGLLQPPLEGGIVALSWGPCGYSLTVGQAGGSWALHELQFAHALPHHHRVAHAPATVYGAAPAEELHVLQAHDRLLLVTENIQARAVAARLAGGTSNGHGEGQGAAGEGPGPAGGHQQRGSELSVTHLPLPYQYISSNWPVMHVAVNPNGVDLAVAGRTGLALYSRTLDRWRLFGDVSQERRIACTAVGWVGNVVLVCTRAEEQGRKGSWSGSGPPPRTGAPASSLQPHQLLLFPKHHLDFSSLLCRFPLAQAPIAMDCAGNHVLLAFEGMDLALFEVVIQGEVKLSSRATASLQLVRDISMLEVGRPLTGITLVQFKQPARHTGGTHVEEGSRSSASIPPTQCVLHRWGGLLSVLDLERGTEVLLGTDIEAYWVSDLVPSSGAQHTLTTQSHIAASGPSVSSSSLSLEDLAGPREVDLPWWGYGPQGMQLWFSSSFMPGAGAGAGGGLGAQRSSIPSSSSGLLLHHMHSADVQTMQHQDLELEFDFEVYPVGISLADAAIVGITQRTVRGQARGSTGSTPSFHMVPESQPVLPCLLRRLLLRGALHEARALALRHSSGPHFSRSLEWLLFTALEAEVDRQHNVPPGGPSLLNLAATLLRSFPQMHAECVVAVARKTDVSLWPALFKAVGSPAELLDGLVELGSLTAAANILLVVDSMEGPDVAYGKAVRLLQVALTRAEYSLASELLRFILFPNDTDMLDFADDPGLAVEKQRVVQASSEVQGNGQLSAAATHGNGDVAPDPHAQLASKRGVSFQDSTSQAVRTPKQPTSSWFGFGWLFGYGQNSGQGGRGGALSRHNSEAAPGTPAAAGQAALAVAAPKATAVPGAAGNTPHSATHVSQHAATARCLVAEHAWELLDQGRLLQLLQLATATTFLPGGLMQLMRLHHQKFGGLRHTQSRMLSPHFSGLPVSSASAANLGMGTSHKGATASGPGATSTLLAPTRSTLGSGASQPAPAPPLVTGLDLLSALSLVVQQLPAWQSPEVEEDARAVLEVMQLLEPHAHVWVLALSILLMEPEPVRAYVQQQPLEWSMLANVIKHDRTFACLHGVIDMLGESGVDQEEGFGCLRDPANE